MAYTSNEISMKHKLVSLLRFCSNTPILFSYCDLIDFPVMAVYGKAPEISN